MEITEEWKVAIIPVPPSNSIVSLYDMGIDICDITHRLYTELYDDIEDEILYPVEGGENDAIVKGKILIARIEAILILMSARDAIMRRFGINSRDFAYDSYDECREILAEDVIRERIVVAENIISARNAIREGAGDTE